MTNEATEQNEEILNDLPEEEILKDEDNGTYEEVFQEEKEEDAGDGGKQEEDDSPLAPTEDEEQTETIDDLEVPEPDVKELTIEEHKAIRKEKQRRREEQQQKELREEAYRREQDELIRIKAEQIAQTVALQPPTRDDFADDAEYFAALHQHTVAKEEVRRKVVAEEKSFVEARIKLSKGIEETMKKGSDRYSDFEDVTSYVFAPNSDIPANIPLAEAINESKFGPDILYMLAKNKKKMVEIASMHPRQALRWIWETEQKIEAVRQRKKEMNTTSQTGGVKPMAKVTSKLSPTKDIGSMTSKEYREHWKKMQKNY